MYFYVNDIPDKVTSYQLAETGRKFIAHNTLPALAELLDTKLETLQQIAEKPPYIQFYVPKVGGAKRLIESSEGALKKIQKKLSYYFQAVYYSVRPDCAYGSVLSTADERNPRNVYTNALQHIGRKWLLNLDLRNFFHTITTDDIFAMFKKAPFAFNAKAARLLARLVTYEGRLPMGAPTSPILSNLATLPLDRKLGELAAKFKWTYTRFIDDIAISSDKKFKDKHLDKVRRHIREAGFKMNEEKLAISRIRDEPEVTGLVLRTDKPDVSSGFIKELRANIDVYHQLTEPDMTARNIFPAYTIRRFRNFLHGQINFVKFIRGEGHKSYLKLRRRLYPRA